jgi:hypothetical protein
LHLFLIPTIVDVGFNRHSFNGNPMAEDEFLSTNRAMSSLWFGGKETSGNFPEWRHSWIPLWGNISKGMRGAPIRSFWRRPAESSAHVSPSLSLGERERIGKIQDLPEHDPGHLGVGPWTDEIDLVTHESLRLDSGMEDPPKRVRRSIRMILFPGWVSWK